ELLPQVEDAFFAPRGRKKLMDHGSGALVAHFLIVGAIGQQELLVVAQERCACGAALIPYQDAPSPRSENAGEFGAGARQVEPVRGLGGGNEIDGGGAQRRLFRRS